MNFFNLKNVGLFVVVAVALVLPVGLTDYWQYVLTVSFFYAIMAAGWNLLGGYTGQFSLAQHTFGMIGAYASALLMDKAGVPMWVSVPSAVALTMILSLFLGIVCLRVSGLYLALITWAFAEVVRNYLRMHYTFTGGDRGLFAALIFDTMKPAPYYYFFLGLAVLCIALIAFLMRSRIGYYLRSIRDDAIAARSMGVNIVRYRILAFVVASGIAGIAGAFYGHSIGLISPVLGDFNEMAMIIIFVVVGGMRTQSGPIIGAITVRITMELLREQSEIRIILLSALVIIIMRFFNGGLMEFVRRVRKLVSRYKEPVSAFKE